MTKSKLMFDKHGYCTLPYFAYGSNLYLKQMLKRCPDAKPMVKVVAHDTALVFKGVADIVRQKGAITFGALYKVSSSDISALDVYEGYPFLYVKRKLTVLNACDGTPIECFAYVMVRSRSYHTPKPYYLDIIRAGYNDWNIDYTCLLDSTNMVNTHAQTGISR